MYTYTVEIVQEPDRSALSRDANEAEVKVSRRQSTHMTKEEFMALAGKTWTRMHGQ